MMLIKTNKRFLIKLLNEDNTEQFKLVLHNKNSQFNPFKI